MMEEIIAKLCQRLNCNTYDIRRLRNAKTSLNTLQRKKTILAVLGEIEDGSDATSIPAHSIFNQAYYDDFSSEEPGEEEGNINSEDVCPELPEDEWAGHFDGFEILTDPSGIDLKENRKCIQLSNHSCDLTVSHFLRVGVRCFLIDLSTGTQRENQALIVHVRESELRVSKEFGFPVVSTIVARISSRYQYTGYLKAPLTEVTLLKGKKVTLTTDRKFSTQCTDKTIYVNARFLITEVREFDFIPIGQDIQLMVKNNDGLNLECCVARGGVLSSRMPVLFPKRCPKYGISLEELEDITFAKEVGINIIVSDIYGSQKYLKDLMRIIKLLECQELRLYARVILNEIQGCEGDMNWVVEQYDGFLVEVAPPTAATPEDSPQIMHLCPDGECFIELAYKAKKPIIFDPTPIGAQKLHIHPDHYFYAFYYPDKYLVHCEQVKESFYFSFLQDAIFDTIPPMTLSRLPYCDFSHTGVDAIARAAVAASFEVHATAIVIAGVTTRMAQKVSHFRPNVPVVLVTSMISAEDYAMVYHNLLLLPFDCHCKTGHKRKTYKKVIFAIAFLVARKILKENQQVIIIYNNEKTITFPDKYITYKFHSKYFAEHLAKTMFLEDSYKKTPLRLSEAN